ncbi:cadherin domain-containing protein [Thiofilum flexile]|uniref:cadherin domain-containing protein n=1 Tax=Thiofilum flexile TaxID=125627 RepID=UPI0003606DE5|nr:cadherin domain-containing protein [Thiofilum flexile]
MSIIINALERVIRPSWHQRWLTERRKLNYLLFTLLLLLGSAVQAGPALSPPMTIVPSTNVNETDYAGYRGVDTSFGSVNLDSVAVAPNGVIGTAGTFVSYRGQGQAGLFFHAPDFTPEPSYNSYSSIWYLDSMSKITALRDNSFLFADYTPGIGVNSVWKITPSGTRTEISTTWGSFSVIYKILQHPTDDNVAYVAMMGGPFQIIKVNLTTGAIDTGFSFVHTGGGVPQYRDMIFNAAGNLVVAQQNYQPREVNPLTGAVIATYTEVPLSQPTAMALQSDGKIVMVGSSMGITKGGKIWNYLARLNADGTVDSTFTEHKGSRTAAGGDIGPGMVTRVVVNSRDEIYISGSFTHLTDAEVAIGGIAKLSKDGVLDQEFISNSHGAGDISSGGYGISDLKIQPDGKLLIAGTLAGYNNLFHAGLVRLHGNGIPDTSINNTVENLAASSGLAVSDPSVVAAATSTAPASHTPGLNIMISRGNMLNHAVMYRAGEQSLYNQPGYQPDSYGRTDRPMIVGKYDVSEYDVAGDLFFIYRGGYGIQAYHTDGTLAWEKLGTTFWKGDANVPTGKYAVIDNFSTVQLYNFDGTNSTPASVAVSGVFDISYTPSGSYLYAVSGSTFLTLTRINPTTGAKTSYTLPEQIISPWSPYIHFYTETDFYVAAFIANTNDDYLYKYKLVDAFGNPDPLGTPVLDTTFGQASTPGWMNVRSAGGNMWGSGSWTVDAQGNVYVTGYKAGVDDYGANITRIGSVGVDIQNNFILVDSVGNQGIASGSTRVNNVQLDWGDGVPNALPIITSNGAGATTSISIPENTTAVTTVTATDADGDTLTYTITGGADAAKFTLDPNTGVLVFNSAPDYETPTDVGADNTYVVQVTVSDGKGGMDVQNITVTLTDVFENIVPIITSNGGGNTASISVPENTTAVTTVIATDANNDTLTYTITGGADAAKFTLDPSTGVLVFASAPDYENPTDVGADNTYLVQVTVSDGNGGTDVQDITVTLTDVFENVAPIITSNGGGDTTSVSISENTTVVTTVTATDGDNDTLTYTITGGADAAQFTLDPSTGVLVFASAPDYENPTDVGADNNYEVQVTVSDGKGGTDVQDLTVTITDVFENVVPIITSDSGGATASISVPENTTAVTTVTATDADNDTLTYTITGGADAAQFTLDPSTGVLVFTNTPDYENPMDVGADNNYDVQVTVSDGKGGTDVQNLTVTVTNSLNEGVLLQVKGLLQGPFNSKTRLMQDTLRTLNLIPSTQPYDMAPMNYKGTEQLNSTLLTVTGSDAIVDWVLVELRSASNPAVIVARQAALLQRDGDVVTADTGSIDVSLSNVTHGDYYVVLKHRNHLAVMTASPITLNGVATVVDFTSPSTAVYGSQARLVSTVALMWAGDDNISNQVIANGPGNDLNSVLGAVLLTPKNTLLNGNYLLAGYRVTDVDLNGFTLFAGPGNDSNIIVGNVLLHPDNTTFSANFVVSGSVPAAR